MLNLRGDMKTGKVGAKGLIRRQLLPVPGREKSKERNGVAEGNWVTVSRSAMACNFIVIVDSDNGRAVRAAAEALDEVDRLESILSIFRPSSEASQVNREAAFRAVPSGPEMRELLQLCTRLHQETEGAFDITTGALTECWGFEARSPSLPEAGPLLSARKHIGDDLISLGEDNTVSFSLPGVRINFGGVGKGYALDRATKKVATHGIEGALLSAGYSSVSALGAGPGCDGWRIGLRHPVYTDRLMATVRLRSCAMGTSGQEEQWFEQGGKRYGHILDPRTGLPPTRVQSVTVITESAACADALATAFFVAGPEVAERYCHAHEGTIAVMLLASDLCSPVVFGTCDRATVEVAIG